MRAREVFVFRDDGPQTLHRGVVLSGWNKSKYGDSARPVCVSQATVPFGEIYASWNVFTVTRLVGEFPAEAAMQPLATTTTSSVALVGSFGVPGLASSCSAPQGSSNFLGHRRNTQSVCSLAIEDIEYCLNRIGIGLTSTLWSHKTSRY